MRKLATMFNLLVVLALMLSACATSTPPAPAAAPTDAPAAAAEPTAAPAATDAPTAAPEATPAPAPAAFSQAPVLEQQVQEGKLPPVEERLPANPQVVAPLVETGSYGGTLRYGIVGSSVTWGGMLYLAQWEHFVQWKPDFSDVEPSMAERIEVSEDGREFTFYLREGMRWSDGEPYGPDDILFYINDVILNEELYPAGPTANWLPENQIEGFKAEQVGENAVKFTFPKPYGTFLYQLAGWGGRYFAQYPRHYLEQYHKDFNPNVDELVAKDSTVKDWTGLFFKMSPDNWGNPDRFMDVAGYPSMGAWVVVQPLGSGTTARFVRNPYYWKVDDQGRQLPYIDEVLVTSYQDPETRTLAMLNGDLDIIKDPGEDNREVFFDAMSQGKSIVVQPLVSDGGNTISIHFNQTSKDKGLAEIFANRDFRIGMSHAINRPEIIEVVFKGQGEPAQVAPLEGSPLFNERLATQYLEYDVALANEYLDKVLPNKDANGMRLRPDGTPLQIIWTCVDENFPNGDSEAWLQAAELMVGYFKAVGVDVKLDVIPDEVLTERRKTNDLDMFIFHGLEGGAGLSALLDPRFHVPGEPLGFFGLGWYVMRAEEVEFREQYGVEMNPTQRAYRDAYEIVTQQTTREAQIAEMQKVLESSADEFWVIGISRPGPMYQPLSTRVGNFPEGILDGWLPGVQKLARPEQWFLRS